MLQLEMRIVGRNTTVVRDFSKLTLAKKDVFFNIMMWIVHFVIDFTSYGLSENILSRFPGNYLKFYDAIKHAYPDIKIISNCDGSDRPLDHPADFYDFHVRVSFHYLRTACLCGSLHC